MLNHFVELLLTTNALVKISCFFLAWTCCWIPIAIPVAILIKWHPPQAITTEQKLPLLASLYLIAPIIVWLFAKIENVSWVNYGLFLDINSLLSLLLGFGLGVAGLGIVFGLEYLFGFMQWHSDNLERLWSILLPILILGLWVGITEELIFRGFLVNELSQDYTIGIVAVISSIIFAGLHLIWEQKQTLPQLPGLWLMGMILVAARLVDHGSLSLAWGLHAAWIWGLTCLDSAELISYTGKASELITGINKQPLAGVAGIFCLLITGAFIRIILS